MYSRNAKTTNEQIASNNKSDRPQVNIWDIWKTLKYLNINENRKDIDGWKFVVLFLLIVVLFGFLNHLSTHAEKETRSIKAVTWVRMRKKKPVISNTGKFFCFNNNVSINLYNNSVVEKIYGMAYIFTLLMFRKGVMVSMLASSVVCIYRWFESRSGQSERHKIGICCVSATQAALRNNIKSGPYWILRVSFFRMTSAFTWVLMRKKKPVASRPSPEYECGKKRAP
jgi:hypothetical protein